MGKRIMLRFLVSFLVYLILEAVGIDKWIAMVSAMIVMFLLYEKEWGD